MLLKILLLTTKHLAIILSNSLESGSACRHGKGSDKAQTGDFNLTGSIRFAGNDELKGRAISGTIRECKPKFLAFIADGGRKGISQAEKNG